MAVRGLDFAGDLDMDLNLNFTQPLGFLNLAGDLNLNSTGLGLGRFWPIFLQNDKSQTFDVAVRGLDFAGDLNMNLNLNLT